MKVVIMAGGKGTRISSLSKDIPKPMIQICGKSVLEHQITCLASQGLSDITLVVGHLGNIIKDYFNDGSKFGVRINYFSEDEPLGTAGALHYLKTYLSEDFLLINGDIIFDVDFSRFIAFHKGTNGLATIITHSNDHPYDSAIIVTNQKGQVTQWLHKESKREFYKNRINAGIHILTTELITGLTKPEKIDLDRDILEPLVTSGKLYAYYSTEYIKDMGTPERYLQVCYDYQSGKVQAKNLRHKQKAVFLDRDGTINVSAGFISKYDQMSLLDGVAEAIRKINSIGWLAIIITNQPVIARGDCTLDELENIHNRLETLLGEKGAFIDGIYFCPHHPDTGFDGERPEYKIRCECRKPKPGLILQAAQDYNIDLKESYMIGDSLSDVEAGNAAGCKAFLLNKEAKDYCNVPIYGCLLDCVNDIISKK